MEKPIEVIFCKQAEDFIDTIEDNARKKLFSAITKKTNKTPRFEIKKAEQIQTEYFEKKQSLRKIHKNGE